MITYGQLVTLFGDEIAWGRVYIRNTEKTEWHNDIERRESIRLYGDRAVKRVIPGYRFLIVWVEVA